MVHEAKSRQIFGRWVWMGTANLFLCGQARRSRFPAIRQHDFAGSDVGRRVCHLQGLIRALVRCDAARTANRIPQRAEIDEDRARAPWIIISALESSGRISTNFCLDLPLAWRSRSLQFLPE